LESRHKSVQVLRRTPVTGWQPHTVRGTFAEAFKKKLGLTLISSKDEDGQRVYRVA
jgi:ABC-type phosphate/phosphonate transport system substrate-binding protein